MTAPATDEQPVPPERLVAIPVRHWGRWVSAALVLVVLALLVRAFAQGDVHWRVTRHFLTDGSVVRAGGRTLLISVLAQAMGIVLGVLFAVMRRSGNPVTSAVGWLYVWFFRGTPVLLQLLIWYNLALIFPTVFGHRTVDVMTPFLAAILGLGINQGAYTSEVVRAGLLSVDTGQYEAAQSSGRPRRQALRRIILPQAMRVIVPPIGNELVSMVKLTSLASVIQYAEMLHNAQNIYYANGRVIELLIVAAIWYLVVVTVLSFLQTRVERRYARGAGRASSRQ